MSVRQRVLHLGLLTCLSLLIVGAKIPGTNVFANAPADTALMYADGLAEVGLLEQASVEYLKYIHQSGAATGIPHAKLQLALVTARRGLYDVAVMQLDRLIREHPGAAEISEAVLQEQLIEENAEYLAGESYASAVLPGSTPYNMAEAILLTIMPGDEYALAAYKQAIALYTKVISDYPDSILAARAVYKRGYCYKRIYEDIDRTWQTRNRWIMEWERLVEDYGGSMVAMIAAVELADQYMEMDEYKMALEHYQKVVETIKIPNSALVIRAKQGIADAEKLIF